MNFSEHVAWQSPSNIALVKYWGKKGFQIPGNPSISITLNACHTKTKLYYKRHDAKNATVERVLVGQKENNAFIPKIQKLIDEMGRDYPILHEFAYEVHTENTFPHGSGIASSASGMSALALCLVEVLTKENVQIADFYRAASYYSRIGSGSACRSVYGEMASWGETDDLAKSSDEYAIPFAHFHEVFKDFQDVILLVDKGEKSVSSTAGHALLDTHVYKDVRYQQAFDNIKKLKDILKQGDLDAFVELVEEEALSLHALMMTSNPSFILMKPNTLAVIEKIRTFRKQSGLPISFTLDAGANVHVLFPKHIAEECLKFIDNELKTYCENGAYICDNMGTGPLKLELDD
jgi:diphosphomevalonate decarboxylase